MKNLKELTEKYPKGLGQLRWGGKQFYEVNSDIPLSLNSYGGEKGFVLNDKGEVEIFDLNEEVFVKRRYYLDDWLETEVEYETEYFWDEKEPKTWWGLTLENYYPHPYYPEKEIIAFDVVRDLPFNLAGTVETVVGECPNSWIELESPDGAYDFTVSDCLLCPEFFRPIYKDEKV